MVYPQGRNQSAAQMHEPKVMHGDIMVMWSGLLVAATAAFALGVFVIVPVRETRIAGQLDATA